ncbi:MAG: HEAT repeat domain-containing protein [Planctomycetota bacterium]
MCALSAMARLAAMASPMFVPQEERHGAAQVPGHRAAPGHVTESHAPGQPWEVWWDRNRWSLLQFSIGLATLDGSSHSGGFDRASVLEARRKQAILLLMPLLAHPHGRVRAATLIALGRMRTVGVLDAIMASLQDAEKGVQEAACLALGLLGKPRADHVLLNYVYTGLLPGQASAKGPRCHRGLAAVALALSGSEVVPAMLAGLAASPQLSNETRAFTLTALGACGQPDALERIAPLAEDPGLHRWVKQALYPTLAKLGGDASLSFLVQAAESKDPPAARSAALGLGLVPCRGDQAIVSLLERLAERSDDVFVRSFATISLGRVGGPAAEPILVSMLHEERAQQVPWAALALGLLSRQAPTCGATRTLLAELESCRNAEHRSAICLALGLAGSLDAERPLLDELGSTAPEAAAYAAVALALLRAPGTSAAIRSRQGLPPDALHQVAFALSLVNDDDALEQLFSLFERDRRHEVRLSAAHAIAHCRNLDSMGRLVRALQATPQDSVRTTEAVIALGGLLAVEPLPFLFRVFSSTNFLDEPSSFGRMLGTVW